MWSRTCVCAVLFLCALALVLGAQRTSRAAGVALRPPRVGIAGQSYARVLMLVHGDHAAVAAANMVAAAHRPQLVTVALHADSSRVATVSHAFSTALRRAGAPQVRLCISTLHQTWSDVPLRGVDVVLCYRADAPAHEQRRPTAGWDAAVVCSIVAAQQHSGHPAVVSSPEGLSVRAAEHGSVFPAYAGAMHASRQVVGAKITPVAFARPPALPVPALAHFACCAWGMPPHMAAWLQRKQRTSSREAARLSLDALRGGVWPACGGACLWGGPPHSAHAERASALRCAPAKPASLTDVQRYQGIDYATGECGTRALLGLTDALTHDEVVSKLGSVAALRAYTSYSAPAPSTHARARQHGTADT